MAALLLVLASGCHDRSPCGAAPGRAALATSVGLTRGGETIGAMSVLGLGWSPDPAASDVLLLGYPNLRLVAIAGATEPITSDESGLHHTYAVRGDRVAGCDGDLRFRLDGRHAELTARSLAADLDAVLALARPTDVYTHAVFDGHPDHAEVSRQVEAALGRAHFAGTLHATLIHPADTATCMGPSAEQWPNPALVGDDPFARFTPALGVEPPPVPLLGHCDRRRLGPGGPPDELVLVPPAMQRSDLDENLKWKVIARYASQVDCARREHGHHASCGYMRAFVKRHEFFWTRRFGSQPVPAGGPVLVVAAHPDDEALGSAGVIAAARAAGRRALVAVVTNGDAVP